MQPHTTGASSSLHVDVPGMSDAERITFRQDPQVLIVLQALVRPRLSADLALIALAVNSQAPNMCSTYSGGFTDKIDYSSMIKRGTSKNSSDLERGTVPRSIGNELFEVPLLVIEI